MFYTFLSLLVLLAVWVSLPLFPAVLIYHRFPHTPLTASGPLANLTINTGGAFAAYLIILLVITPLVDTTKDVVGGSIRPYWEIRGEVNLIDETGKEIEAVDELLDGMKLRAQPDMLGHAGNTLRMKIPEESEGDLPKIEISFPNTPWRSLKLELNVQTQPWWRFWARWDSSAKIDHFRRTIDLGKVDIHKLPPPRTYDSTRGMDNVVAPVVR